MKPNSAKKTVRARKIIPRDRITATKTRNLFEMILASTNYIIAEKQVKVEREEAKVNGALV